MGYAKKREESIKKKRIAYIVISAVVVVGIAVLVTISFLFSSTEWKYGVSLPNVDAREEKELRIHYIDVGQGDATLIELPDGKIMLIDGGDGSQESNYAVMRYLNKLKIQTIDYLVATHADADHCGGLAEVVKHKDILRAFLPVVQNASDKTTNPGYTAYQTLFTCLQQEGCLTEFSRRSVDLSVTDGDTPYTLAFLYPYTLDTEHVDEREITENNTSAVIWLDYHGASAIFAGDIDSMVEATLVSEHRVGILSENIDLTSTEILKVAHHGSSSSTSDVWLTYLQAKTAVISCGVNNLYAHPSVEVAQRLLSKDIDTYRTDLQGTVTINIACDGAYTVETRGK